MHKKNEVLPFEDASYIEKVAYRHDASFVVFGNHNKKRPNNLIFHRLYDMKILDMLEVGIEDLKMMKDFSNCESVEVGQQPVIVFQGDAFDLSEKHIKFKNMMIDFFRIKHLQSVNILTTQRLVIFTAKTVEGNILMQQFESAKINEGLAGQNQIDIKEIGPRITMSLRRVKYPDNDTWKQATKVKKSKAKQEDKKRNISYNILGQRIGKAYIQQQDLGTLALKKIKRRKITENAEETTDNAAPNQDNAGGSDNE